jgi:hypothetical protein
MKAYTARSPAPPDAVWALLAQPARWSEWAPHVRGAWSLGAPEVRDGARGAMRLLGVLPVPAAIVSKRTGREWTWRVPAGVRIVHRVEPYGPGSLISIELEAPGPLEPALAVAYGPLMQLLVRRLARVSAAPDP